MTIDAVLVCVFLVALWAGVTARGPWQAKLALILAVPLVAIWVHGSLDQYRGYPRAGFPPAGAEFEACYVREPTEIDLWAIPEGADRPRAYRVAYSRSLHEACQQAQRAKQQGVHAGIKRVGPHGDGPTKGRYHAYVLPPAHLPQKPSATQ